MGLLLYPVLTIFYLILFVWGLRSFRESSFWGTSWLLFIMVALIYDNLILSIGTWIGASETLEVLSLLRYLLNVFLTPTFVFIAWDILRRLKLEWAEYLTTRIIFNVYTFVVTVVGVYTEILWITLEPVQIDGVLQYLPQDHYIPVIIIFTILPLVVAGLFMWRQNRWPILLVGVIMTLLICSIAMICQHPVFVAIAECGLIVSLFITEWNLRHEDYYLSD